MQKNEEAGEVRLILKETSPQASPDVTEAYAAPFSYKSKTWRV